MNHFIQLYIRLKQIDVDMKEARRRLPAHTVKPVLLQALFLLEEERDVILRQLRAMPGTDANPLGEMMGR